MMRPKAGRECSVCAHPSTADITKAIVAGGSKRTVADRFGLGSSAVQRHMANCLRLTRREKKMPTPASDSKARALVRFEGESDEAYLIRRAERLLDHAEAIVFNADSEGDSRLGLQAIRETRASIELLMKARGVLQPEGVTVNVDARRQSIGMSKDEVRAAIAALTSTA